MTLDVIITGKVVTLSGVFDDLSLGVKNGKIVSIGTKSIMQDALEVIDVKDNLILSGVVDAHVHSLGDASEGHWNSTCAAAAGGVTTINDHPLDLGGAPTSSNDIINKARRTAAEALIDFSLFAEGVPEKLDDITNVANVGITGYKVLMHATSGAESYGVRAVDDGELYAIFQHIAQVDQTVMIHAENEWIINYLVNKSIREGKTYLAAHHETRPEVSETVSVATAVELARALNCRLHLVHLSVPRSFEIIDQARKEGVKVTGETCPHFLMCNHDRWKDIGAQFKINPPLRSEGSRLKLWDLLKQGKIHLIASDHAPHPENHETVVFDNFSGSPGVETLLPLIYSEGICKGYINLEQLTKLLSYNPSKLLGIYPQKGAIEIGADADFVVFDPNTKWTISGSELIGQSGWSIFEGLEVQGKVVSTFSRGDKIYENGRIVGKKGRGQWVKKVKNYVL